MGVPLFVSEINFWGRLEGKQSIVTPSVGTLTPIKPGVLAGHGPDYGTLCLKTPTGVLVPFITKKSFGGDKTKRRYLLTLWLGFLNISILLILSYYYHGPMFLPV